MGDLELLSIHWRDALDAAEDAIDAVSRCGDALRFTGDEVRELAGQIRLERTEAESALVSLAAETQGHLHRSLTGPRASAELLGLDRRVVACVFDLDGVLTASATLHSEAWQEALDELLARHHAASHEHYGPWRPFDPNRDYLAHIHGRPRIEGVHAFLASRGIRLPEGTPDDEPGADTAFGVANRKNELLQRALDRSGDVAFAGAVRYLEIAHEAGLRSAVVSASANTRAFLARAGLDALVDEVVDGDRIESGRLERKPAPDWIVAACRRLQLEPDRVATFETTAEGVDAGREAGVRWIVGVDRLGQAAALRADHVDRLVSDLSELIDPSL